jgi:hypothetical protein
MPVFPPIPDPLEAYAAQFDDLFSRANQRAGFRQYLAGLLLPAERTKTLTALANTEPVVGAQAPAAQRLQWFLSESTWDAAAVTARRQAVLRADPATAPHAGGVLIIDETGDRKDGAKTAHVGRQYLGNRGKTENGVVSVGSVWADEGVYYPLAVEPYTPKHWFPLGKADPAFRTKPQMALALVDQALAQGWPLRAVVADSFYGEHAGFTSGLTQRGVPYVVALKPSHSWWAPETAVGAVWQVAAAGGWTSPEQPGAWQAITRHYRDGHTETWWALEGAGGRRRPPPAGHRHRRSGHAAGARHLVSGHHAARGGGRPGRGRAPLRAAQLGGATVQAGQNQPGLEPVPGPRRHGDASSLGAGAVRLCLLLVGRDPRPTAGHAAGGAASGRPGGGRRAVWRVGGKR